MVLFAVILSLAVKAITLVRESSFDFTHQLIVAFEGQKGAGIVAFTPANKSISILNVKNKNDLQALRSQIPIDASVQESSNLDENNLPSELLGLALSCRRPGCNGINSLDAFKLYLYSKKIQSGNFHTAEFSLSLGQSKLMMILPELFTDEGIYREALSISVVNASGEPGLGLSLGQLLSNIGANVISITSGEARTETTMQSSINKSDYTLARLEKVLQIRPRKMQKYGISDIIITIGSRHPRF